MVTVFLWTQDLERAIKNLLNLNVNRRSLLFLPVVDDRLSSHCKVPPQGVSSKTRRFWSIGDQYERRL